MRAIIALFLALAIGAAPVGLPIGAASGAPSEIATADCAGACQCDKAGLACVNAAGCAWQCAFNAPAVIPSAARTSPLAHAVNVASVQSELATLSIRPPLPPPQA